MESIKPVKTVLVTGADGMLGSELVRALTRESDVRVVGCTSRMMDVTDLESVKQTLEQHRPTHVYHCAAYTAVDSAEKETPSLLHGQFRGHKEHRLLQPRD
jgi:dTDP-4-dehydrorhamnose reductase